jgi:hypothetical protein
MDEVICAKFCVVNASDTRGASAIKRREAPTPVTVEIPNPLHTFREVGRYVKLDYFCHDAVLHVLVHQVCWFVDSRQLEKLPVWAVQETPQTL